MRARDKKWYPVRHTHPILFPEQSRLWVPDGKPLDSKCTHENLLTTLGDLPAREIPNGLAVNSSGRARVGL